MAGTMPLSGQEITADRRHPNLLPLVVQFGSFILILGIPDGALGVLWPSMRQTFHLPLDALGVLTVSGTTLYFTGGLLGARVQRRLDVGRTMLASCAVGLVALLIWSAAPTWLFLLAGVALLGLARGVIDAVLNAEAALDGGVRRLGLLHACWAVGGTLGPVLVAAVVASTHDWRLALIVVAVGVVMLTPVAALDRHRTGAASLLIHPSPGQDRELAPVPGDGSRPDRVHEPGQEPEPDGAVGPLAGGALRSRLPLVLTVTAFAVYCAAEGGPIAWGYTYLLVDRHLSTTMGAVAMAGFWAALTLGRFALALVGDRVDGPKVLEWSCILLAAGMAAFWLLPGAASVAGLPVAGLGSAAVFPLLIALTPARVGAAATSRAVGASIAAATVGGPVAVAIFGVLAAHLGVGILGVCLFAAAAGMYVLNRVLTTVTREPAA